MLLSRAAIPKIAFYLSFFPSPFLALKINSPNISSAVKPPSINISWGDDAGDPEFIDFQIQCGTFSILNPSVHTKASIRSAFVHGDPTWTGATFKGTCHIRGTDDSGNLLATSPDFPAPQLPTPRPGTFPGTQRPVTSAKPPSNTRTTDTPITVISRDPPETHSTSSSSADTPSITAFPPIPLVTSGGTSENSTVATPTTSTTTTGDVGIGLSTSSIGFETPLSSSLITSTSPTPTISTPAGNRSPHTSSRASIIGGIVGGLAFLAFLIGLIVLYRRRKGTSLNLPRYEDIEKATTRRTIYSRFFHPHTVNIIPDPLRPSEDYSQPESKRERFERVQQEMNTAQRQRVLLQWDLDSQNSRNASSEGPENDIEGFEIEQRLRQQLQNMSSQISELEAQLTEVELPPDYVSSM